MLDARMTAAVVPLGRVSCRAMGHSLLTRHPVHYRSKK